MGSVAALEFGDEDAAVEVVVAAVVVASLVGVGDVVGGGGHLAGAYSPADEEPEEEVDDCFGGGEFVYGSL